MSESLILTILSLGEMVLLTGTVAVFAFIRNRRLKKDLTELKSIKTPAPATTPPQISFGDYLQDKITQSRAKLSSLPEDQAEVMETRLEFLQAEAHAQQYEDNSEEYWEHLVSDFSEFLPQSQEANTSTEEESAGEDDTPILNELDDIDIHDQFDDIPVLDKNVDLSSDGVQRDSTISLENANDDLERLRSIISRQHDSMDELKKSLNEKNIDIEQNQQLAKKLEQVEVAQAQLNMCVETLEKENERLQELIGEYENSPQAEELSQAKQQLDEANERISNLEQENDLQAKRITELETEISELEKKLNERNKQLERLHALESDLSLTEENGEESHDPDSLMQEIESLTELITKKSEELSKLQSEQTGGFGFDAELPEINLDDDIEPQSGKAVGSS